jgi:NAD+ synthase
MKREFMNTNQLLSIDPAKESDRIIRLLKETINKRMHRYGAVVGISGGIDSSVVLALCVRTFGPDHVLAIMMPEKESSPESREMAYKLIERYGVISHLEDITPVLTAFGCYEQRDKTIQGLFPEYAPEVGYKCKIILPPNLLDSDVLNFFTLTITDPKNLEKSMRLPLQEYLNIVAATNLKQRARMAFLYYYAEKNNYAVAGTANKNEHDLGFFVKYGDGGADVQPIAHLFKTQVYQLAEYLEIPEVIRNRPPTTDTYSAGSTQQEFFYRLPFALLDTLWCAQENRMPISEAAALTGLTEIQVQRAWDDIVRKKRTTDYLRMEPISILTNFGSSTY